MAVPESSGAEERRRREGSPSAVYPAVWTGLRTGFFTERREMYFQREACYHGGPLISTIADRPVQNDQMRGARILRNEAYNPYDAMTKDEAQHSRSRFAPA